MGNNPEDDVNDEGQCFKDKTKTCCANYVYYMSFFILLLSIGGGVYGYLAFGGNSFKSPKVGSYSVKWDINPNAFIGGICIVGAVFGLIVAIFGLLLQKCMTCIFAVPYAILTFLAGLLALIFGAMAVGGSATRDLIDSRLCGAKIGSVTTKTYLLNHYNKLIDKPMCSSVCPCKTPSNSATWNTLVSSNSATWKATGRTDTLSFGASNTIDSYANGCSAKVLAAENAKGSSKDNEAIAFLQKGGLDMLKSFESQFTCGGVCFTPMFYVTQPLSKGPPAQSCDVAFIKKFQGQVGPAIVAFLTAVIMFTLFGASFPLCTGKSDPNDAMGGA